MKIDEQSKCRTLVVSEGTIEDAFLEEARRRGLSVEEEVLIATEMEVARETISIVQDITVMNDALQKTNSEAVTVIEALQEELQALMVEKLKAAQEFSAESKGPEYAAKDDPMHAHKFDTDEEVPEASKSKGNREKIKKLFKRIASKTHPDKTKDPFLQELFVRARLCVRANDYASLLNIWDAIKLSKKKNSLVAALAARVRDLQVKINLARDTLTKIKASQPYAMQIDYVKEETRPLVETHYAYILVETKNHLQRAIHAMDPSRYPPPPVLRQQTTWTFTTTASTGFNAFR